MSFRSTVKKVIPKQTFMIIEPYGHLGEAITMNTIHGFPARGLKIIGVTGTNGKTTTCFLIHRMLHEAGLKVGLMTTVAYGVGLDIKDQQEHITTLPVPKLLRRIQSLKAQGIEWLVLETTSHALAQHRVWGIPYSVAVLTNITHEHLDYHGTFERYIAAKKMLFEQTDRNQHGLRLGVINADDPVAEEFSKAIHRPVLYGIDKGDVRAKNVKLASDSVEYQTTIGNVTYDISCNIPGSFNVYNSLAAVTVGHELGLSKTQIEQGIKIFQGVEGRMTKIEEGQDFTVIVDFAHTPDSFEKLFKDMRPVVKGKLIIMFGSAGRRDEAKRAIQGRIAGKYADEVIVTEEDDRDVDGNHIMNQIAEGAESQGKMREKDLFLVLDRTKAISFALTRATSRHDVILLLGKGHEKTIERADGEHPWNETKLTHRLLQQYLEARPV